MIEIINKMKGGDPKNIFIDDKCTIINKDFQELIQDRKVEI